MANCLIGLGSNLGDRAANLQTAISRLSQISQTALVAQSSFRQTTPAGGPQSQATYLNAAATVETSLSPHQLLAELQRIENELGRVRTERWGPRTIDLDLLLYDRVELESLELTLPHPRMSFRRFVLEPAAEIAAEMVYPINGWTIQRLHEHLQSSNNRIVLAPTHSLWCKTAPATRLLKVLESEPAVQPMYRRLLMDQSRESRLAAMRTDRKSKLPTPPRSTVLKDGARWWLLDFWICQLLVELLPDAAEIDARMAPEFARKSPCKLIVVWQPDESPVMPFLERLRRNPECQPVLWIPKVTFEQAQREVIAAMAAME